MVRDVHDALARALGDPPPWQLNLDDVVAAARRTRRRRRAGVAASSSAAVVLTAGAVLAVPSVLDRLHGDPTPSRAAAAGPGPSTDAAPLPAAPRSSSAPPSPSPDARLTAFFRAGYGYDDAVLLARLWGGQLSSNAAKLQAGSQLLAGGLLEIKPGQTARTVSPQVAIDAFFGNGYGYDDAVRLAAVWHVTTSGQNMLDVKTMAGRRILAGEQLPPTR